MQTDETLAELARIHAAAAGITEEQAAGGLKGLVEHLGITADDLAVMERPKEYYRKTADDIDDPHYESLTEVMRHACDYDEPVAVTKVKVVEQGYGVFVKSTKEVRFFANRDAAAEFVKTLPAAE